MAWQDTLAEVLGRSENEPPTTIDKIDKIDKNPSLLNSVDTVNIVNSPPGFNSSPNETESKPSRPWPDGAIKEAGDRATRLRAHGWAEKEARVLAGLITARNWGLPISQEIEAESILLVEQANQVGSG